MRSKMISTMILSLLCIVGGCSSLAIDSSTDAFAAKDLTLVSSCQATPGQQLSLASGVDSCHFTVGDTVAGSWTLIAPPPGSANKVTSGTVDVYFKDLHKSYPISSWTIPIDFASFLGISQWSTDLDEGVVEALVTLNWSDNEGIMHVTKYRSIAVLIVTASGYDRMPIDSGNQAWGATCKAQFSTTGRSAIQCQ